MLAFEASPVLMTAMKKALLFIGAVVVAVALLAWIATWFRAPEAVAKSAAKPWPGQSGGLDTATKRVVPTRTNAAAQKLLALARSWPKNDAVDNYVWSEVSRGEMSIGAPPPLGDVSAIRELLLRETLTWETHTEVGDADAIDHRALQVTVSRALIANALARARAGDASAWEDLHAVWKLARSLDGDPQVMAQTAALSMARMINATAWKMPLPAPEWFAELQARDNVRPLLDAFQHQTAAYWKDGARMFPTKWLASSVEHDRKIAEELYGLTRCDVTTRMNELGVDLTTVWRRAFRYRAEREATANAIRVREGKPIEKTSQCSDGAWTFDGATLRFSRDIAAPPSDKPMPLVLKVKP